MSVEPLKPESRVSLTRADQEFFGDGEALSPKPLVATESREVNAVEDRSLTKTITRIVI